MILNNCRITIRDAADDVGISFASCQAIFSDVLGMKRALVNIVKFFFNFVQEQRFMELFDDLQRQSRFAQKGHSY